MENKIEIIFKIGNDEFKNTIEIDTSVSIKKQIEQLVDIAGCTIMRHLKIPPYDYE